MRGFWAFLCTTIGSLIVVAALILLAIPPARILPASILEVNDHPAKGADAIVLMQGDAIDRVPHVANLYKQGYAKKIVFVEAESTKLSELGLKPLEGKIAFEYLTKYLNVPAEDIIFNEKTRVSSSREEVRAIFKSLDKNRFRTVILATSWYHSSRAKWIMEKSNSDHLRIDSLPSPMPKQWYRNEQDFLSVYNEYLKWVYYYIRYEILS